MTSLVVSEAFCDFLRVTSPPDSGLFDAAVRFGLTYGLVDVCSSSSDICMLRPHSGDGLLRIENSTSKTPYVLVSASGGVCTLLRSLGVWSEFLHLLYDHCCKVTIAHVSVDTNEDGAKVLDRMESLYPTSCKLGQRGLRTTTLSNIDDRGLRTGTFYVGKDGRPRIKAAVYDKRWERLCKAPDRIHVTSPPCTRYELKFRDNGIALGELARPDSLFYHYASPSLLPRKKGVKDWTSYTMDTWKMARVEKLPYDALSNLIANGYYGRTLASLSSEISLEGRVMALKRIAAQLGIDPSDVTVTNSQSARTA